MSRRRYFFLDEACPVSEIPSMMCRVVTDKLLPLNEFVPFTSPSATGPSHTTDDIIPSILPTPSVTTNRKDFLETVRDNKLQASLTSFFGLDFARSTQDRLSLETQQVKRYTLNNPAQHFKTLMADELYARDVRHLLQSTHFGRAYLVVGFLTTSGATWTQSHAKESTTAGSVTLPVSAVAGAPTGLDPTLGPAFTAATSQERTMQAPDEEIFAVAYCAVKMAYSFDRKAAGFTKKTPVIGAPKRANAKHLAFSKSSDEEEEDDDGSNEDGEARSLRKPSQGADITLLEDGNTLANMGVENSFELEE